MKYGFGCTKVGMGEYNIVEVLDFKSRKPYQKIENFEIFQKTVLGIVANKMHGRFQAERMNGSMVSDIPKLTWVSKI